MCSSDLDHLEAGAAGDADEALARGQARAGQRAHQLVQGVVATDVLAHQDHLAVGAAPGGRVAGRIALDSAAQTRTISVGNPTLYFANALRAGLVANGIDVLGGAADAGDLVDAPVVPVGAPELQRHDSPPLSTLADTLMKLSQNLYAETLLRTLGFMRGYAGTADAGLASERDILTAWGIPASEVMLADGSGLSRYNLVTAGAEAALLAHVWGDARLREPRCPGRGIDAQRRQRRGDLGHAGGDHQVGLIDGAEFVDARMDMDQRLARARRLEQRVARGGHFAQPRADQIGRAHV